MLSRAGVTEVGIERGDGPLVEALIAAPFTVYVIAPNQIRNLRRRCGSAGNKDDHFDAYVLADTLRTDRHRLTPDTPATVSLRMTVRARQDLVVARVAMANQLRAHLANVLPGAIGLFSEIDSAIGLAFLTGSPPRTRSTGSPRAASRRGCGRRLRGGLRAVPGRRVPGGCPGCRGT